MSELLFAKNLCDNAAGVNGNGTCQASAVQRTTCRYTGRTILAVGAHPDDIELGLAGTVAWLNNLGAHVVMAVVSVPNAYETRVKEATQAAAILGGDLRIVLNNGCRRVEDVKTYELVKHIDDLVEEIKPAAIFTHGGADFHRDHTLVYNACISAGRLRAFDTFSYYPTSTRPSTSSFRPQVFVDISHTLTTKMRAIHAHVSQFSSRGLPTDFVVDVAREQGRMAGVPYAEGFEVVRMMLI